MKKINIKTEKLNKIFKALFFLAGSAFLFSCSQNINGVIDLPYTQEIVIRGVLEAGKPVKGISLTKTMPALDTFSISEAELSNVTAVITCNGAAYPLHYVGNTLYDTDSLVAVSGNTYHIEVKWNGMTAYANTIVPFPVDFDSLTKLPATKRRRFNSTWTVSMSVLVNMSTNAVCVGGYEYIDTTGLNPNIKTYTSRAIRQQNADSAGFAPLTIFSKDVKDTNSVQYDSAMYKMDFFVESYDPQFYDYFNSRLNGDSPNSSFGFSGSNIRWNVNGGVGLFIGMASNRKKFPGY